MTKLKNGWVEGTAQELLELSDADMEFIETRRAPAGCLRELRARKRWTQAELAARLHTSQSRVAKLEAGDRTVSLDLLFRALYRIGVTRRKVASAL